MLNTLPMPAADALHGVMARYAADRCSEKMDLGVGVYRDATGASPIMRAVLKSERAHIAEQTTKRYVSLQGDEHFLTGLQALTFGNAHKNTLAKIQTVGGTGGIYLGIKLAAIANPNITIMIGTPTWPVHFTICDMLGVKTKAFSYFDKTTQTLQFESICDIITGANPDDMIILHGPCHNPSGQDLSKSQFHQILSLCEKHGVIPLIDAAYYGLGADLEEDLKQLSEALFHVPRAMLVMSCSKAFGLYRERTGALFIKAKTPDECGILQKTIEKVARNTYSMPPAHGGAVVGRILTDPELTAEWKAELNQMRQRLEGVRAELIKAARGDARMAGVATQKGIFSLLPISPEDVDKMASDHAIYMPSSGRINIAGFKVGDADRFCDALSRL